MRPGSLYAAFGSKEGLYKEALTYYAGLMAERLQNYIDEEDSTLGGIKRFVHCNILESDFPEEAHCFLVKTVLEIYEQDSPLLSEAQTLLKKSEENFTRCFQKALSDGEIPDHHNPQALGSLLQIQLFGLRSYLRSTQDRDAVKGQIEMFFKGLDTTTAKT